MGPVRTKPNFYRIPVYDNTVFVGVPKGPRTRLRVGREESLVTQRGRSIRKLGIAEMINYRNVLLGQNYDLSIDDGIPESITIFVHYTQAHIVPADRPVYIWAQDRSLFDDVRVINNTQTLARPRSNLSTCFGLGDKCTEIYVILVRARALSLELGLALN